MTYQIHPVCCAASLAVQHVIRDDDLLANCRKQGAYLQQYLTERIAAQPLASRYVGNIRGSGLFWGVELVLDKETKAAFPATLSPRLGERILIVSTKRWTSGSS